MATKSSAHLMTISANWQALFITATFVSWLSIVISTLIAFSGSMYFSLGTWAFQISIWLDPLLFFTVAFALLGHYKPLMKRIFMACLAATIGTALYGAVASWFMQLWSMYYSRQHPIAAGDTSWWSAFGMDWALMVLGLVLFGVGLYVATRKARR